MEIIENTTLYEVQELVGRDERNAKRWQLITHPTFEKQARSTYNESKDRTVRLVRVETIKSVVEESEFAK